MVNTVGWMRRGERRRKFVMALDAPHPPDCIRCAGGCASLIHPTSRLSQLVLNRSKRHHRAGIADHLECESEVSDFKLVDASAQEGAVQTGDEPDDGV